MRFCLKHHRDTRNLWKSDIHEPFSESNNLKMTDEMFLLPP
jgi:hypothetical protein